MSAEDEWKQCRSWIRVFIALNENLSRRDLIKLVRRFLELVDAAEHLFELLESDESGSVYQALFLAILGEGLDGPYRWMDFVRDVFPEPPSGFEFVGRYGNEPKKPPPADSPRSEPYRRNVTEPHKRREDEDVL